MAADPSLTPELIEARSFTSGFRGFDQSEVRNFLSRVATEVRSLLERIDQLDSAWQSAEERASRPPVLDEEALIVAVGEETASILRAARTAASDLRARAGEEAGRIVAEAQASAAELRFEAEGVLGRETKAAEDTAARILDTARAEATETVDKARMEADALKAAAQHERNLTIEGAMATRERILDDLSRRRRVASVQIEQLRAGRERLLESYAVVRRTLEEVNDDLNRADAEARAAADEVGRRMRDHGPDPFRPAEPAADDIDAGEQRPAVTGESAPERPAAFPASPPPEPPPQPPSSPAPQAGTSGPGSEALAAAVDPSDAAGYLPEASTGPRLRVVTDDESPAESGARVEDVFARLRAGRAGREAHPAAPTAPAVSPTLIPGIATEAEAEGGETEEGEIQPTHPDEGLLRRRQAVLADLESSLTRRLKRALQDEQNDLLDRLRSQRDQPTAASLLPALSDQVTRYSNIAHPQLEEAASGGVAFAVEILDQPASAAARAPGVGDLGDDAATTIVESLRRRLEHAIAASAGDEQQVLVEAVGSAYREWKSERIERIAGDVLAAAFSRGTWHQVPDGGLLRWVVQDIGGPCPDCDDDALAGSLPKGEEFPTGQRHPPAHPGCHCLLVPIAE